MASEKLQDVLAVSRSVNSSRATVVPRAGTMTSQARRQRNLVGVISTEGTCACAYAEAFGILTCVQLSHGIQGLCHAKNSV